MCSEADVKLLERERLLSGFLAAVKVCQIRYGGRTELATESDPRVATLCQCLEEALNHGLRNKSPSREMAAIRQVTDLVSSGLNLNLSLGNGDPDKPVLWWYVRELLTRHEFDRFLLLRNINSDQGRGKAWLRSLLNEHSLERYMHIMVSDEAYLDQWYESWALLRDQERAAMLPNLAAGLDSILFAINIDNEAFCSEIKSSGGRSSSNDTSDKYKSDPEPHVAQLSGKISSGQLSPKKLDYRRRKRKVPSQLVSFDDDILITVTPPPSRIGYFSAPSTCVSSPSVATSYTPFSDSLNRIVQEAQLECALDSATLQNKVVKAGCSLNHQGFSLDSKLSCSNNSLDKDPSATPNAHSSYEQVLEDLLNSQTLSMKYYSPSDHFMSEEKRPDKGSVVTDQDSGSYKSGLSNISNDSFQISDVEHGQPVVPHLKTLQGGPVSLIPLSPDGEAVFDFTGTEDARSFKSSSQEEEFEEALETTRDARGSLMENRCIMSNSTSFGSVASGTSVLSSPSISKASTVTASSFSSLTYDELRSAVLEISRARDAAEEKRTELVSALSCEMESSSTLRAQLTHEQNIHSETLDRVSSKINALTRENELLRHQLKKYVGAVQMLRREGFEEESITGGELLTQPSRQAPSLRDYHDEAVAYESKLIQVAEMHGELMEFNEQLQRLLKIRESQVRRLKDELVELRGPLPNEEQDEEFFDILNISSDLDTISPRTLINIWIPTAFLSGPSSDTHHVYQIYVRIRDDEWNVYRRFAQFYELHKYFKKKEPIVKTFDFPQKKTFGYKDNSVVENRRLRLQQYLRKLVNLLVSSHPNLSNEPDKSSFTAALPFLSDSPQTRDRSGENEGRSRRKFLSRLSSSSRPDVSTPTPQYNGL